MAYKVIVSIRAQKEIEDAIDFYTIQSYLAPARFIESLQIAYELLITNPFYAVRYRNVRAIHLSKFPFSLYFTVDEDKYEVRVLSCFHKSRDPKNRPA
jgi:plasmid stabilization system protein ParE